MLTSCLRSLAKQIHAPYEVVVVDNGSTDETKNVCKTFAKTLHLRYFYEPRTGIPYGRNMGMKHAEGVVFAFIDDDCRADIHWVESIAKHFETHRQSVGVVGKTNPTSPNNIYSAVEYTFYYRWVLKNLRNPGQIQKLLSGTFVDFKNAAFKRSFITKEPFSTNVPFGDVGDEDVELGSRLYSLNNNIYYDPAMRVSHQYSITLQRLFVRNFWNGYANTILFLQKRVRMAHPYPATDMLRAHKAVINKMVMFRLLVFIYPLFSRVGSYVAKLTFLLHINLLPKRK